MVLREKCLTKELNKFKMTYTRIKIEQKKIKITRWLHSATPKMTTFNYEKSFDYKNNTCFNRKHAFKVQILTCIKMAERTLGSFRRKSFIGDFLIEI